MWKSLHRFASLGLKSRIDAGSSTSHSTRLALDVCMSSFSTVVRQWRRKRVLMRPEAAFPYVFAAEGAQHPPNKPPRSTPRHAHRPAKQATTHNAPLNEKARLNIAEADNSLFYLSETGRTDRPAWRFEKVLLWSKFPP